jgi:hypothetical protein
LPASDPPRKSGYGEGDRDASKIVAIESYIPAMATPVTWNPANAAIETNPANKPYSMIVAPALSFAIFTIMRSSTHIPRKATSQHFLILLTCTVLSSQTAHGNPLTFSGLHIISIYIKENERNVIKETDFILCSLQYYIVLYGYFMDFFYLYLSQVRHPRISLDLEFALDFLGEHFLGRQVAVEKTLLETP